VLKGWFESDKCAFDNVIINRIILRAKVRGYKKPTTDVSIAGL